MSGLNAPLISVIIPFYNLQGTVTRCLESVLSQTYGNYELICVDDGSTDGTGDLLDEFADRNQRIRVIHKPNGGLSSARNTGIEASQGDYLSFIDGDDVVSPYYLQSLASGLVSGSRCLVIGKSRDVPERCYKELCSQWISAPGIRRISKEDLCKDILAKKLPTIAPAKLCNRAYYEEHPFPLGVRYEEIRTIGDLVNYSQEICVIDEPIYGYLLREGSIVWTKNATGKQGIEYIDAIQIALDKFEATGFELSSYLAFFKAFMFTRVHDFAARINDVEEATLIDDIAKLAVKQSWGKAVFCNRASYIQRARVLLYMHSPILYDSLIAFYNREIKGMNVG